MPADIIEPPSELYDITLLLSVILSFVLIIIAIWFAVGKSYVPAFFSMTGVAMLVLIIGALKGVFKK